MVGKPYRREDVLITPLQDGELVTACDSFGGIGDKMYDTIKLDPYLVGKYAAFVPLVEVMSRGAKPFQLINTLSVEMEPTGKEIIRGIKAMSLEAGLSELAITGSTEDNIVSYQTGVGVTVLGWREKERETRLPENSTYYIYGFGKPKMGQQFLEEEIIGQKGETMGLDDLQQIMQEPSYVALLSVGSKGMLYEANLMAKRYKSVLRLDEEAPKWLNVSAGPGTCSVVALDKPLHENRKEAYHLPVYTIGQLVSQKA